MRGGRRRMGASGLLGLDDESNTLCLILKHHEGVSHYRQGEGDHWLKLIVRCPEASPIPTNIIQPNKQIGEMGAGPDQQLLQIRKHKWTHFEGDRLAPRPEGRRMRVGSLARRPIALLDAHRRRHRARDAPPERRQRPRPRGAARGARAGGGAVRTAVLVDVLHGDPGSDDPRHGEPGGEGVGDAPPEAGTRELGLVRHSCPPFLCRFPPGIVIHSTVAAAHSRSERD